MAQVLDKLMEEWELVDRRLIHLIYEAKDGETREHWVEKLEPRSIRRFQDKNYTLQRALYKGSKVTLPLEDVLLRRWSDEGMDFRDLVPLTDLGISLTRAPVGSYVLVRKSAMDEVRRWQRGQAVHRRVMRSASRLLTRS